jgi:short-subunit dehydrogenase
MAAKRGARLVLNSRNEAALRQLAEEINGQGGEAMYQVADVADEAALRVVADLAIARFGGFDTWVNNAGVSIYGRMTDVPTRITGACSDTNFWGVVNGSRIAAEHLRHRGGAIINIGSTLSDRAIPGQGMYCASKHAVKGFTDALRMELEEAGAAISVSLIKPAAIDTPYRQHAKNYLPEAPDNPPPVYAPEVVAEAILHCAEHAVREVFAGGGGKVMSALGYFAPRLLDTFMEWTMLPLQQTGRPARTHPEDALFHPSRRTSSASEAAILAMCWRAVSIPRRALHPMATAGFFVVAGLAAVLVMLAQSCSHMAATDAVRVEDTEMAGLTRPSFSTSKGARECHRRQGQGPPISFRLGYKLSSEEQTPSDLVRYAQMAEESGFTFALISDHYHPWIDRQGQSPFVWSVLGAIAQATKRLTVGTAVTCPTVRIHPAIIAQAAATTAALMPGRFFLGLGTGENLNEHIVGQGWPETEVRQERLEEAIEVIRQLWRGGNQSHHGRHFTVENARLYSLPDELPPLLIAAGGPQSATLAGRLGDGMIGTGPEAELFTKFDEAGGTGKPATAS